MQLYLTNTDLTRGYKKKNNNIIPIILIAIILGVFITKILPNKSTTPTPNSPSTQSGNQQIGQNQNIDIPFPIEDPSCGTYISQTNSTLLKLSLNKKWNLIGNEFSVEEQRVNFTVKVDDSLSNKDLKIQYVIKDLNTTDYITKIDNTNYTGYLDSTKLQPGTYNVRVIATGKCTYVESSFSEFIISYPIYVAWTTDWEGLAGGDYTYAMKEMEKVSDTYGIPITHMFNPRIFLPSLSGVKDSYLSWIKTRQNKGDEIALHLHMFYDIAQAAGVTPKKDPKWNNNDQGGYNVPCSAYQYDELVKIFKWSIKQFQDNGLGKPNAFRAGGWFADIPVLRALQDVGITIDTSGKTSFTEQIQGITGYWDLPLTATPYHPSIVDQNTDRYTEKLTLMEIPNTAGDSWAYDSKELKDRFLQNANQLQPLTEHRIAVFCSHPHWSTYEFPRIIPTLQYIAQYTNSSGNGPVIFTTLSKIQKTWNNLPQKK